jgi:hypothetical protein
MLRKVLCAGFIAVMTVTLVAAEEFTATIKKVDGKNITLNKGKKGETVADETLTVADNVKVAKGNFNKDTKKIEAGDALEGGLSHSTFKEIGEKGVRVRVVTDNNKITEIYVTGKKKGN